MPKHTYPTTKHIYPHPSISIHTQAYLSTPKHTIPILNLIYPRPIHTHTLRQANTVPNHIHPNRPTQDAHPL
ncbi:hypothetical protein METBIDRAFT_30918, partial [Metschnikowia bicuspidata var. bicuspidata NRRL YB-4993]